MMPIIDVRWVISNFINVLHDPAWNFVVLGAPISPACGAGSR
jgi:hypothetical protein